MTNNIEVYQSDNGKLELKVELDDETVWLTQAQIAELFEVRPQNITMHLKNIFANGELQESATCKDSLQVQIEWAREGRITKALFQKKDTKE